MTEKDEIEKKDAQRALPKITDFLTVPHGIPKDTPEIVDTQADLSNNAVAEMLVYHRTIADRFKMLEGKMTKGEVIENFANRISLLTWAQNRKSREEAVLLGNRYKPTRLPAQKEAVGADMMVKRIKKVDFWVKPRGCRRRKMTIYARR